MQDPRSRSPRARAAADGPWARRPERRNKKAGAVVSRAARDRSGPSHGASCARYKSSFVRDGRGRQHVGASGRVAQRMGRVLTAALVRRASVAASSGQARVVYRFVAVAKHMSRGGWNGRIVAATATRRGALARGPASSWSVAFGLRRWGIRGQAMDGRVPRALKPGSSRRLRTSGRRNWLSCFGGSGQARGLFSLAWIDPQVKNGSRRGPNVGDPCAAYAFPHRRRRPAADASNPANPH